MGLRAAACYMADDPDLFYPERGGTPARARAFCDGCAVKAECLAWAISKRETYGIWGGTSERQRRRLLQILEKMMGRPIRTKPQHREQTGDRHAVVH